LTGKKGSVTYITDVGESTLTDYLTGVKVIQVLNPVKGLKGENPQEPSDSEGISFLRNQVNDLQIELSKEREHSRAQAERLATIAEQLAELTRNNQVLLGAEQTRTNPALLSGVAADGRDPEESPPRKRGIFGFFRKGR
jgi:hypothetical protein